MENIELTEQNETKLNVEWHDPNDETMSRPENNSYVKAIYKKRREDGLYIGIAEFYYLSEQWEFRGRSNVLLTDSIIAWKKI